MADPNYNWLVPTDFSFASDPFVYGGKKYYGPGGLLPNYDPAQGPLTVANGDQDISVMPEGKDYWTASPELAAMDPRWNDWTQSEVVGAGEGWYDVKLKSGDKEGTIVRIQKDPTTGQWVRGADQGTVGWNTNSPAVPPGMAAVIAAPFLVGGAQALMGAGGVGAGTAGTAAGTAGAAGGFSLPTLGQIYAGGKAVLGGIGAANTLSQLTTGAPIIGNNGHLYDPSPSKTNTGSNNVTTPAPPGSNTGTNPTNPTTPGSDNFDLNTLFNFLLGTGGQAISADRQENMADQLLAMYNDAKKQAEPWEEKLRQSYTPAGQQALLSSPEFMGQLDAYKTGLDRKASRYGTLTNPETGIQGAERGRTWALQQKAYGLLGDYRKPIQDQVELYTKNAADYKMLAAFGLASEANIPGQWAQTLAKQFGTGDGQIDWNKVFRSADAVVKAGGSILDWWNKTILPGITSPDSGGGDLPYPGHEEDLPPVYTGDPNQTDPGYIEFPELDLGPPVPSIDDILAGGDIEGPW